MVEEDNQDKDKKKESSEEKDSDNAEEEQENQEKDENENDFERFSEDEDSRIDLSGFSGERTTGVLHSNEKPRDLESQIEGVPIQNKREKKSGEGERVETKQDLYSEAQLYNEQIKKYQDEITIDLNQGGRRGGKLERESIITPKKAESLMAKSTELRQHETFREDYVAYESKNLREENEDPFVPHEKKHKEDARKYIARGR